MALLRSIAKYFEQTKRYSTRRFILEMALMPFLLKALLGVLYGALGGVSDVTTTTRLFEMGGISALVFGGLLVAPLLETLIGQWFPIWLVSFFTKNAAKIVILSAIFFSLLHIPSIGIVGILIALPPGIFLSWCFLVGRKKSRWRAYWTTTAVHCVHSACDMAVFLITIKVM